MSFGWTANAQVIPTAFFRLHETIVQITTGYDSTCVLGISGKVYCVGSNPDGQLGDGTTTSKSSFVSVIGLPGKASFIDGHGGEHFCAIVSGGVWCWGDNAYGQIGDGTASARSTPVQVSGLTSGVTRISVGSYSSCAIQSGAAYCWGSNSNGHLGDGTTTNRSTPVQVSGLTSGVTDISAGSYNSYTNCAIVSGTTKCWGNGASGMLGNGTTTDVNTPVNVSSLSTNTELLATGNQYACVRDKGVVKCWGSNTNGKLGDGTTTQRNSPVTAITPTGVTSY